MTILVSKYVQKLNSVKRNSCNEHFEIWNFYFYSFIVLQFFPFYFFLKYFYMLPMRKWRYFFLKNVTNCHSTWKHWKIFLNLMNLKIKVLSLQRCLKTLWFFFLLSFFSFNFFFLSILKFMMNESHEEALECFYNFVNAICYMVQKHFRTKWT